MPEGFTSFPLRHKVLMKVIATQNGTIAHRYINAGETFEIPDHLFTPVWMTPVVEVVVAAPPQPWFRRLMAFLQRDIRSFLPK
jgi:hypothetical protein